MIENNFQRIGSIVILTGAGVSAESGIPTFRDSNGLWENHHIDDVATPEGFKRNPILVHNFYNERRQKLLEADISPNLAHKALGKLEKEYKGMVTVITQNIDNLHERGGSLRVIHMHGELFKGFCQYCETRFDCSGSLNVDDVCDSCNRRGGLRPDVVWFGEIPYHMEEIVRLLEECSLFISIGTSGSVYPAAGFVEIADRIGAQTIEINLESPQGQKKFQESRYGLAGELLPILVEEILGEPH